MFDKFITSEAVGNGCLNDFCYDRYRGKTPSCILASDTVDPLKIGHIDGIVWLINGEKEAHVFCRQLLDPYSSSSRVIKAP